MGDMRPVAGRVGQDIQDWELERVRRALVDVKERGYRRPGELAARPYSYTGLAELIAETAGRSLSPAEAKQFGWRLREFMTKGRRLTGWRPGAVSAFLRHTDEDDPLHTTPLVTDDFFSVYDPGIQAQLHLDEHLRGAAGSYFSLSAEAINGTYQAVTEASGRTVHHRLRLWAGQGGGTVQVVMEEQATGDETTAVVYTGWSVLTPEATVIAFVKDQETAENHVLLGLAVDAAVYSGAPMRTGIFVRANVPAEVGPGSAADPKVFAKTYVRDNLLIFHREP